MTKSLDKSISPIHSPATSCHLDPQKLPPKVKQREQMPDDRGLENVDCRLQIGIRHKPLAFKQGKIYNLKSKINNKSTILNLKISSSCLSPQESIYNLQSAIGNQLTVQFLANLSLIVVGSKH